MFIIKVNLIHFKQVVLNYLYRLYPTIVYYLYLLDFQFYNFNFILSYLALKFYFHFF